jgi:hypothetical protein
MNLTPCTPAEASFALSMCQDRSFQSGGRVAHFLVAQAHIAGVERTRKPIPFTLRGIARNAFGSSVTRTRQVLEDMKRRGVIEQTHVGTNRSDPSEVRFLHPMHWDLRLASGIDREEFGRRCANYSATQTRALLDSSARVSWMFTPMGSAASFSDLNEAIAERSMDPRALPPTVSTSMDPRAAPTPSLSYRDLKISSLEEEEESSKQADPRGDELLAAIRRGGGGRKVYGRPAGRARYLAQECNGRLPELVAIASNPSGPRFPQGVIELLEDALRRPAADPAASSGRPTDRAEQLRRDLAAAELAGDEDGAEGLRQALTTMGA